MRIEWATRQLERCYTDHARAVRRWNVSVARKYVQRVNALHDARDFDTVRKIRTFRTHRLRGDREGRWAIDLTGRWRLIVTPLPGDIAIRVEEVTQHYGD